MKVREAIKLIEKDGENFSAYSPDLPGCAATGHTISETMRRMREAIRLHIDGMTAEGVPVPPPSTRVEYIEISV